MNISFFFKRAIVFAAFLISSSIVAAAQISSITFTNLVDTSTAIPGGSGNYLSFGPPSISSGDIVFRGFGSSGQDGIYKITNSNLAVVADTNTAIPNGTGNFLGFGFPTISNGTIGFSASGAGQVGIYSSTNGNLQNQVNQDTTVPGTMVPFGSISNSIFSNGNFTFLGATGVNRGVYASIDGTLDVVANGNTPVPGGIGNFVNNFSLPLISNDAVAFFGSDATVSQFGIFTNRSGTLENIAGPNVANPGGTGNFTGFLSAPSIFNDSISFLAVGGGPQGVFLDRNGVLEVVANITTPIPEGMGNFASFELTRLRDDSVLIIGSDSNGVEGIYIDYGMGLEKIIDETDTLDGKTIVDLTAGFYDPTAIAIFAQFDDSSQGLYLADITLIPIPAAFWLLGSSVLGMLFFRRKQ